MKPTIFETLKHFYPNAHWALKSDSYDGLQWFETQVQKPTKEEFDSLIEQYSYIAKRQIAYPNIGEQLDMLWHTINEGKSIDKTSDFYLNLKTIKDTFPKPTTEPIVIDFPPSS